MSKILRSKKAIAFNFALSAFLLVTQSVGAAETNRKPSQPVLATVSLDMLGAQVPYLEHIIGPAKRVAEGTCLHGDGDDRACDADKAGIFKHELT